MLPAPIVFAESVFCPCGVSSPWLTSGDCTPRLSLASGVGWMGFSLQVIHSGMMGE